MASVTTEARSNRKGSPGLFSFSPAFRRPCGWGKPLKYKTFRRCPSSRLPHLLLPLSLDHSEDVAHPNPGHFGRNLKGSVVIIMAAPSLSPSTLNQVIQAFSNVNASRYVCAAAIVIMFYDWLLTLPTEIDTVWRSRKVFVSYLFFIVMSFFCTRRPCLDYI
jgi:hypothetical protein